MTQLDWSPEYPLRLSSQDVIPNSPGVYQVLTKTAFGRLKGSSRIVSIGSAKPSLRRRLAGERMKDPKRYLSRAEKWLLDAGHELWFRFAITEAGAARTVETELFVEYEIEHWELPPSNNKNLPGPVTRVMLQDVHERLPQRLS